MRAVSCTRRVVRPRRQPRNTVVASLFEARAEDFRAQTHRIYWTGTYPLHLELDVLGAGPQ